MVSSSYVTRNPLTDNTLEKPSHNRSFLPSWNNCPPYYFRTFTHVKILITRTSDFNISPIGSDLRIKINEFYFVLLSFFL